MHWSAICIIIPSVQTFLWTTADRFVTHLETLTYPPTSETTGEIKEGEANVPNINHATATANL